jgi:hypothetical protein
LCDENLAVKITAFFIRLFNVCISLLAYKNNSGKFVHMIHVLKTFVVLTFLFTLCLSAQVDNHQGDEEKNIAAKECEPEFFSQNGHFLPASGMLRILVIFCEINFSNPDEDPTKGGNEYWQKHQLPIWANDLGNPNPPKSLEEAVGLTQYFLHASSGQLVILADYLVNPINNGIFSVDKGNISNVVDEVNNILGERLNTSSGLTSISDFDHWTLGTSETRPGMPKISPNTENPGKYDHVMFIWRNKPGVNNTGAAMSRGFGKKLLGYEANSYSENTSYRKLPFNLIRHEFTHLILGGNNFHCGGGGHAAPGYFQHLTGGWSLLSLHDGSLNTWNAWDRQRLGWKVIDSPFEVSARDEGNTIFVNGDLDATDSTQAGIYTLRDFASIGDALRIKLPFLDPESEFQQYLWIENHQGKAINKIPFDRWQYEEDDRPCVQGLVPGMYAYMQIDREKRAGCSSDEVFKGYADYLRPMPANGFWDRTLEADEMLNECVSYSKTKPFNLVSPNAFSGSSDKDRLMLDLNNDDELDFKEVSTLFNYIERKTFFYKSQLFALGHSRHAFTLKGNSKIGMGTNPSSANMMNLVRSGKKVFEKEKNVRKIYLNGVSIEILSQADNLLKVKVRFDDVEINQNTRWCAEEIVLNPIKSPSGNSMIIQPKVRVTIDQGKTATRMNKPQTIGKEKVFATNTVFRIMPKAKVKMDKKSRLIVEKNSVLILEPDTKMEMGRKSRIIVRKGGVLEIKEGAIIQKGAKSKIIIADDAKMIDNGRIVVK